MCISDSARLLHHRFNRWIERGSHLPFIIQIIQCMGGLLAIVAWMVHANIGRTSCFPIPSNTIKNLTEAFWCRKSSGLAQSSHTPYAAVGGIITLQVTECTRQTYVLQSEQDTKISKSIEACYIFVATKWRLVSKVGSAQRCDNSLRLHAVIQLYAELHRHVPLISVSYAFSVCIMRLTDWLWIYLLPLCHNATWRSLKNFKSKNSILLCFTRFDLQGSCMQVSGLPDHGQPLFWRQNYTYIWALGRQPPSTRHCRGGPKKPPNLEGCDFLKPHTAGAKCTS